MSPNPLSRQTPRAVCCLLLLGITLHGTPLLGESCSVAAGDKVSFVEPKDLFESLSGLDLTKGEFETTAAFEARKPQLVLDHNLNEPVLLRGTYHPDAVRYDADEGHLLLPKYAWHNPPGQNQFNVSPSQAGILSVSKKRPTSIYGSHQVVLSAERLLTRRNGIFAYYKTDLYGLFERDAPRVLSFRVESWSGYDTEAETPSGLRTKMVTVDATPAQARELKNALVIGFQASLKEPYVASGTGYVAATVHSPESYSLTYSVIVADMLCVVIANPDNEVLRVVGRARE